MKKQEMEVEWKLETEMETQPLSCLYKQDLCVAGFSSYMCPPPILITCFASLHPYSQAFTTHSVSVFAYYLRDRRKRLSYPGTCKILQSITTGNEAVTIGMPASFHKQMNLLWSTSLT